MYSAVGNAALPALGFPIRRSTDHRLFSAYPWLIAAVHVLHQLLVPRHPPCALDILTVITFYRPRARRPRSTVIPLLTSCAVFKVRRKPKRPGSPGVRLRTRATHPPASRRAGLSKLNSVQPCTRRYRGRAVVTRSGRRTRTRRAWALRNADAGTTGAPILELPRKEVIQPQLPLRLPCYDFTPVTSPTFDGSLP
jgi:hypothetical protein